MHRMRTIIVDDHRGFRVSLQQFVRSLERLEYVGEAQDGRAALEMLTALDPQLVLMDICMPRMNGVEACCAMKQAHPDLPVVLYSVDTLEIELASERGVADLCVTKYRLFDDLTSWICSNMDVQPDIHA